MVNAVDLTCSERDSDVTLGEKQVQADISSRDMAGLGQREATCIVTCMEHVSLQEKRLGNQGKEEVHL